MGMMTVTVMIGGVGNDDNDRLGDDDETLRVTKLRLHYFFH